jgi:hypothetical protein
MPPHRRVVAQESSAAVIYLRTITQFEILEAKVCRLIQATG